jgi:hypothetical protein
MTDTREAVAAREEARLAQYPARQLALARSIGQRFLGMPKVKPRAAPGLFGSGIISMQSVLDEKLITIAWTLLANRLADSCRERIFDHTWMLAFDGPPFEPWGFVSEPYLDDTEELRGQLDHFTRVGHRFIEIHVLTKDESAWNPGSCLPIVGLVRKGEVHLRSFVRWALLNVRNAL